MSWVKYVLATCANVNEVVAGLRNYQITPMEGTYQGQNITNPSHFAVNDASGDAAIIEFNGGQLEVFHGPQYNVMTNEPRYAEQLANLTRIKSEEEAIFCRTTAWRVQCYEQVRPDFLQYGKYARTEECNRRLSCIWKRR